MSYSFDNAGYRVSVQGAEVDVEQPTLLFTGESIIAGYGLAWEETIPARVGALLGMQSANLAVSDYSNDQSYLRLAAELPHFREPLAVVTLFMPALFDRNLLDNRPRLAARDTFRNRLTIPGVLLRCCAGSFLTAAAPLLSRASHGPAIAYARS